MSRESARWPLPACLDWTVIRCATISRLPPSLNWSEPSVEACEGPYKEYLRERWATGLCTARSLFAELRARGYQGGATLVSDYLRLLREHPDWWEAYQQQQARQAQGKRVSPLSARQAAWLFISHPRKLKLWQVWELESLRLQDEELGSAYQLVQDFWTMVTQRQVSVLPRWLNEAQACGIASTKALSPGSTATMMLSEQL